MRRESALHSVGLSTLVGLLGTTVYRWTRATRCLTRIVLYTKADANRTMRRSNFKTAAAAMLNFQGFKILTSSRGQRASLRHLVKFHRNRSSGCGDIAFNRFSKWPTSVILVFTARCYASAVLAMALCSSVRLSVTSRCSTKTAKRRITQITPRDSPGTLVF